MKVFIADAKKERGVKLGDLSKGEVFHFAGSLINEAMEDDAIFIVADLLKEQIERVNILNLHDGLISTRDGSHRVIKLDAQLSINY